MVRLLTVSALPSITFLRVFPGFIARPFRGVGVGFESRICVEPGFPPISHVYAYAAHQGGLVLWYYLERPETTPKIRNWSVFVLLDGVLYSG